MAKKVFLISSGRIFKNLPKKKIAEKAQPISDTVYI